MHELVLMKSKCVVIIILDTDWFELIFSCFRFVAQIVQQLFIHKIINIDWHIYLNKQKTQQILKHFPNLQYNAKYDLLTL